MDMSALRATEHPCPPARQETGRVAPGRLPRLLEVQGRYDRMERFSRPATKAASGDGLEKPGSLLRVVRRFQDGLDTRAHVQLSEQVVEVDLDGLLLDLDER